MEAAFKQELQNQSYPSFSLKYLPVQAMTATGLEPTTTYD